MTPYRTLLVSILFLALTFGLIASSHAQPSQTAYLTTHTAPPGMQHIHYDETIQGDLDDLGYFEFFGETADIIVIRMTASGFTPHLLLEDIYGAALVSGEGAPTSVIGPYVLRQAGRFRLAAGRRESVTQGSFTLLIEKVEPLRITYGDTVEVNFSDSETAKYFSFDGGILDVVNITVTGDGSLDTRVRLRESTDSYDFISDDDSGDGFNPRLSDVRLAYNDLYILTLERPSPGSSGAVTLTLEGRGIASLDDEPQIFTLNAVRSQVILPFEAATSERVQITVKIISGSPVALTTLLTQDGHTFAESRGGSLSEVTLSVTVPYSGTVNVIVDSLVEVEVQVSLERLG